MNLAQKSQPKLGVVGPYFTIYVTIKERLILPRISKKLLKKNDVHAC